MRPTLLFTPGPVPMSEETLRIGGEPLPYFRNAAFSRVVHDCERLLSGLVGAPPGSRMVLLTASGTAAMEAAVINLLNPERPALVIDGGTFGERFAEICAVHQIPCRSHPVGPATPLRYPEHRGERALLINGHETSTGRRYDLEESGRYCRRHEMLHVVDAISLFVTDPLEMTAQAIDALIVSSHKGLALPPGLAMVVLSPRALAELNPRVRSYYLDFQRYLRDGERGQTPFTPAVGVVLALRQRLQQLADETIEAHVAQARDTALYFRESIEGLPLTIHAAPPANAITALEVAGGGARRLVRDLEERWGVVVTPNGGALADRVFRVSHMGVQGRAEVDRLVAALRVYFEELS